MRDFLWRFLRCRVRLGWGIVWRFCGSWLFDGAVCVPINVVYRHASSDIFFPRDTYHTLGGIFLYDRNAAVAYANLWWDGYNPAYPKFDNDCANYVSQCLRAGGVPMWGAPNREKGWWMNGRSWSFSWSTAHSLRWYLAGETKGITSKIVQSPAELDIGDVIVYDFQNDGRFDHSAIVTAKDGDVPYVNAHTYNVRQRLWDYKDSYASTPDARYLFFKLS